MDTFKPPRNDAQRFNCPHCGAFAHHRWFQAKAASLPSGETPNKRVIQLHENLFESSKQTGASADYYRRVLDQIGTQKTKLLSSDYSREESNVGRGSGVKFSQAIGYPANIFFSDCISCEGLAVWLDNRLLWPVQTNAPKPNEDLPEDISEDYAEAAMIARDSPRGAAALLRLCIEKLCNHVLGKEQKINTSIEQLEKQGLSQTIANALHIVRVIGNDSVHPGELDLRDDLETVRQLFVLVNRIADALITQPKKDAELWNSLPENKRKAVEDKRGATVKKH